MKVGADPAAQLFADRVDDAVGEPAGARVVERLQRAVPLLPLEERVLERVAHGAEITQGRGECLGDFAQRRVGGGPQAAGSSSPRTFQTVTGPLRRTGATAGSPRSQRASGEGIGWPGWRKLRKGAVTR